MAFNLKTKIWQTGSLDWWGMFGNEDLFLGNAEFPNPAEEGDEWIVRATGDKFKVIDGEIRRIAQNQTPPQKHW